jgi:hypothetical protein
MGCRELAELSRTSSSHARRAPSCCWALDRRIWAAARGRGWTTSAHPLLFQVVVCLRIPHIALTPLSKLLSCYES